KDRSGDGRGVPRRLEPLTPFLNYNFCRPPFPLSPRPVYCDFLSGCHLSLLAAPLFWAYIPGMVLRSSRGRLLNAPAAFIHPCQPDCRQAAPIGTWLGARAEA